MEEHRKKEAATKYRLQEEAKGRIKKALERNEQELQKKIKKYENKQKELEEKKILEEKRKK